jgi:hypothetical protein
LNDVSRQNDCADKLATKTEEPLATTFQDGLELAAGGKARAALGVFGFEGDAQAATHFYYTLDVSKRVDQADTTAYVSCCKEKGTCGYGFISALIYGTGEYATATETSAEGGIDFPVAGGAGGFVKAKVLHRRSVHGFVAAVINMTDSSKSIGLLGDPAAAGIVITAQELPDQGKATFEEQKIEIIRADIGDPQFSYAFKDTSGPITENEFVRRYRNVTDTHDLDAAEIPRHANRGIGMLTGGLVVSALSAAAIINGIHAASGRKSADCDQDTSCSTAETGLIFGVIGGTGGLVLTGWGTSILLRRDGVPYDHVITKPDADLYAAKYNRALLRKTIRGTSNRVQPISSNESSSIAVVPVVSPGFAGLVGRF